MLIQKVNSADKPILQYSKSADQNRGNISISNNSAPKELLGVPRSYITFKAEEKETDIPLSESAENLLKMSRLIASQMGHDEVKPEHIIEASIQSVEALFGQADEEVLAGMEPDEFPPLCKLANITARKNLFLNHKDINKFIKAVEELAEDNMARLQNLAVENKKKELEDIKISPSLQKTLNAIKDKAPAADAFMLLGTAFNTLTEKGIEFPTKFLQTFSSIALYKDRTALKSDYLKHYDARAVDVWNKLALGSNLYITYSDKKEADRLASSIVKTINAPKHGSFSSKNTIVNVMDENTTPLELWSEVLKNCDSEQDKQKVYIVNMDNLISNIPDFHDNGFLNSPVVSIVNLENPKTKFIFLQNEDIYYQLMQDRVTKLLFSTCILHSIPPMHSYEAQELLSKNKSFLKDIQTPFTKEAKDKAVIYADKIKGVYPDKAVDFMKRIADYYGNEKKKITEKDVDEFAIIAHNLFNKSEENTGIIYDTGKTLASLYGKDTAKKDAEALVRQIKTGRAGTKGIIIYSKDEEAGSGRRYLAQAIAGEAKVPFIEINTSDYALTSADGYNTKDSPKTDVHKTFEKIKKAAEQNQYKTAIVFINNFEELAFSNPYLPGYKQAMSQVQKEMANAVGESVNILVIGSTDEAYADYIPLVVRGFNQDIAVDSPAFNNRSRKEILINRINEVNLPLASKTSAERDYLINKLVKLTQYMSFVQIKSMIEKTEQIMLERNKTKASIGDFIEAYLQLCTGRTSQPQMPEYNKRATTSHECGHATNLEVMSDLFKRKGRPWHQSRDVNFITLDPRGNFLGAVFEGNTENSDYPFEAMFTDLVCSYGGYSCEKMFFGMDGSAGISQDLAQASSTARRGIEYFGFGYNTGKISNATEIKSGKYNESVFSDMQVILKNAEIVSDLITENYKKFNEWFTDKYSKLIGTDDCMVDGDDFRKALFAWKKSLPKAKLEELDIMEDIILDIIKSAKNGKIYYHTKKVL